MTDVRESVDGSTTVRIAGLDAKETSLGTIRFELEGIVADGVSAAATAVEGWRGGHAETFAEEVNPLLRRLARLVQRVGHGQRAVAAWPESPARDPLEEQAVNSAEVEVPASPGSAAAQPVALDMVAAWCVSVRERVPSLTAGVGLEDVTAEVTWEQTALVTREQPVFEFPQPGLIVGEQPRSASVLLEPDPVLVTETRDPALYIAVPDVSDLATVIVEAADHIGTFASGVALAFRREDERLLDLIMSRPDLADELLAWWQDGEIGSESSLVILLAYFDVFDSALTGDEDGIISMEDLVAIGDSREVPAYVRDAAAYLVANPALFTLIETVNDATQPPSLDVTGEYSGDGRMSRDDVELFLEFNDHLTVLDENYAAFDNAAHPDRDPNGTIDVADLEALASGDGAVAATAAWLLAHQPLHNRVARYLDGGGTGTQITRDSLVVLSVDQQVHADDAASAARFVDRHMDALLGETVGDAATGEGMSALFDTALTESEQQGELLDQVIDAVADEGAIHNPGLPLAFANGTAANMDTVHSRINDDFDLDGAGGTTAFDNTHAFLRETMRDPAALEVVTGASSDYFRDRLESLPPEAGRQAHLNDTGRTLGVITQAHANSVIANARIASDATAAQDGTLGGTLNFLVGLIPVAGELNDFAGIGGASVGNLVASAPDDGAAGVAAREYLDELPTVGAVTMTAHHFSEGLIDPHDALESMREYLNRPHEEPLELDDAQVERIFFDGDGSPREQLNLSGMNEEQRTAFGQWATSTGVTRSTGQENPTLLQNDVASLRNGILDADPLSNRHGR